jgi:hypothetical protein
MAQRRVQCPKCQTVLLLPLDLPVTAVRCGACRTSFQLPRRLPVPEETIYGWLHQDRDAEEPTRSGDTLAPLPGQQPRSAEASHLRLVMVSHRGALLEFSTEVLRGTNLRSALPRVCVHCLDRRHLAAHLVIFAPQLRDSISLEAERQAGDLVFPDNQLADLSGAELLLRLPKVPSIPSPGNLPMPYWLCDLCSGAGEVSGQIQVNTQTGHGTCRLQIRNLQVAGSFVATVDGARTSAYSQLRDLLDHMQEDRFDALPTVVRHRLEQWFKPHNERFLAYAPDRSRSRTEDGMAGVVVSTRRLVYHRPPLHGELLATSPVTLVAKYQNGKEIITFTSGEWLGRTMPLDRASLVALRRALSEGQFKATWT